MGLGKTVQIVAFLSVLCEEQKIWPFLIIVPQATVPNWFVLAFLPCNYANANGLKGVVKFRTGLQTFVLLCMLVLMWRKLLLYAILDLLSTCT
jgi:hypothetical protein